MRNYAGTCKGICSVNLVDKYLIQLLPSKSSVFVVHFSNAFQYGNEAFTKVSSQNKIVTLLPIFHMPHSKYRGVKIHFYSCRYQNQNVSLVTHSYRSCSTFAGLVLFVSHLCRTRVASVASRCSCRNRVACVWHSYCQLDQIILRKLHAFFILTLYEK